MRIGVPNRSQFQSTPPRGGRRFVTMEEILALEVSIHAPAWGATSMLATRGRVRIVSIHAPAWGATRGVRRGGRSSAVSIHAPAWGATRRRRSATALSHSFNPRPRVGGDTADRRVAEQVARVSIHAPAWGATWLPGPRRPDERVSIHAPAWGATRWRRGEAMTTPTFQSTPPRGGRRVTHRHSGGRFRGFNPRPRVGGDAVRGGDPRGRRRVSIHAPAWGATYLMASMPSLPPVSIHAPAWGATVFESPYLTR